MQLFIVATCFVASALAQPTDSVRERFCVNHPKDFDPEYSGFYQGHFETGCSYPPNKDPRCTIVPNHTGPTFSGVYMRQEQTGCSYSVEEDPKVCTRDPLDRDPQHSGEYNGVYQVGCSYPPENDPKFQCTVENEDPFDNKMDCCVGLTKTKNDWNNNGIWYYQCKPALCPYQQKRGLLCETKRGSSSQMIHCKNDKLSAAEQNDLLCARNADPQYTSCYCEPAKPIGN